MVSGSPGQIEIVALGDSAAEASVWRMGGELRVSVVVKACFALEPDAAMRVLEPEEILRADVHHGHSPSRSVWLTSDLAPYLPKADVLLSGHACAPEGQSVTGMSVRLAVYGDGPLLDRSIHVYGDRTKEGPAPFDRMPLVYERAHGGVGFADNPFGTGAGDDTRPPNLVDPDDPQRVACFGPIGRSWPRRRKLRKNADGLVLEGPLSEIPPGFDFAYFQAAPPDQQIAHLGGNEWVVLEGVHPVHVQIASSLPSAIGQARVFGLGPGPGRSLALVADTLRIDGDTLTCQVVWRGSFPIPDLASLETLSIHAGVETAERPIEWPAAPVSRVAPVPSTPRSAPVPPAPTPAPPPALPDKASWDRTVEIRPETAARAAAAPAVPFREGPAHLPPRVPAAKKRSPEWTTTLILAEEADRPASIPFPHPSPDATVEASPLPTAPPPGMDFGPKAAQLPSPPHTGGGIELLNDTPLCLGTVRWEHNPPRDCLTVVAKATCDLVAGGPAVPRPKAEPLADDRLLEGARAPVAVHPSDLALFKVRADVMLTGHAHAPPGGASSMKVRFRFGDPPRGFDRTLLVFGARAWEKAGALAKPGAPETFLRIPLRYDHAFGGAGHDANPAGIGFSGKAGRPGPLPHLEDPAERLRTPKQAPPPACFGPIARVERERRARAAKGARSLADHLDWTLHQAAPPSQQLPFLRGDETFELDGIHPQHPHFEGSLPGIAVRCLAERPGGAEEVPMRLDTAFFDLDEKTLTLVWRGLLPVSDERSPDVRSLRLLTVPAGEP